MTLAKKKRFWSTVDVTEADTGFVIQLDGRTVKTPEKRDLLLPTRKAADLVAREWDDASGELSPTAMPATRWANVSVDKMGGQMAAVVDMLAAYGENDLLCYRSTHPQELIARQADQWDAPLNWASLTFKAPLLVTSGVIPVEQPNQSVANLRQAVETFDPFELAAFHDLVQISGSLVLALAVSHQHMVAEQAWQVARVDEIWQAEQWGVDDEAAEAGEIKRQAFLLAEKLLLSVRKTLH
ncbi:ATP12 family chaperone protein [Neptunicoccus cionae]|uniref:ATPase n=1 Tax=Neptunicoccus cionae TaxID=2035344 RepID=A0A916VT32_9RHOB|nr:ATP12 family protein [Amylibacter cionae]GGA31389.1 ATPase [Amylibacter cionae]